MRIVADERIAALDETFARHGELIPLPGRDIGRRHLQGADALITRTVTRVDRELLEGTAVRFVGTATIGSDHFETAWLDRAGIAWTAAPGCNADATAQYTLAIYLLACRRLGLDPLDQRFGIVGCGNVGGRLRRLLEVLGVATLSCDPPLEAGGAGGFHPLEDVLGCEVVSLHVPLTRGGRWPTFRMLDRAILGRLPANKLVINAARGDVVEGDALQAWLSRGGRVALDVWPGEPDIDPELVRAAIVATPHIAGYSLDGKFRATSMVYGKFCEHFGLPRCPQVTPPPGPVLDLAAGKRQGLADVVLQVCPVERDDRAMRERLDGRADDRVRAYDTLRSHYPGRRDFAAWRLAGDLEPGLATTLQELGFSVTNH